MIWLMGAVLANIEDELVIVSLLSIKTGAPSLVHLTVTVVSSHVPLYDTPTEQVKVTIPVLPTMRLGEVGDVDILTESIVKTATTKNITKLTTMSTHTPVSYTHLTLPTKRIV